MLFECLNYDVLIILTRMIDGMIWFDLSAIFLVFSNSPWMQLNFQIALTTEAGILYQFQIPFDSTFYSDMLQKI